MNCGYPASVCRDGVESALNKIAVMATSSTETVSLLKVEIVSQVMVNIRAEKDNVRMLRE